VRQKVLKYYINIKIEGRKVMNSKIIKMKLTLFATTALSSLSIPYTELIASDTVHQEDQHSPFQRFSQWQYLEHMAGSGGGTGVHVYFDPKTQQKFTVKDATHQNHLIEELTAKGLYRSLGFNAPQFHVLDRTSSSWPKGWNSKFPEVPRLLISEFIEDFGHHHGHKKEKILRWVDVLLGNFDLGGHNYVIDKKGDVWPIDFGGSLRLRANGEIKAHENLWGYFWPKEAEIEAPTQAELRHFRANLPRLFGTLLDLHHQLSIPDFNSLWNIIASRTHSFLAAYDSVNHPILLADRPSLENHVGGGVLLMTDVEGIPHVLLAKRKDGSWSDLGGGAKTNDRTINRTAWREAMEEMGGFLPLDYTTLVSSPYLEHQGEILYRMFLHKVEEIDVEKLKAHVLSKDNPYAVEHSEFALVPLASLNESKNLFNPMQCIISSPHAQAVLKGAGQGLKWSPERGGTPYDGRMRMGEYSFDALKLELLSTSAFKAKANTAAQLKSRFSEGLGKTIHSSAVAPSTQTSGFLKAMLQEDYVEGDEAKNLTAALLSKSSFFKGKPTLVAEKLPYIERIISAEHDHPNHFVYYHGGLGHYGLLWIIASVLRQELFLTEQDSVKTLRLYENAFNGIDSARQHLEDLGEDNDYAEGGQARMLSTNMSLLGSIGRDTSETIRYFFANDCMDTPDQPLEILKKFLETALRLPQMAVDQFMKEVTPYFGSLGNVGALFQLFMPSDLAEQYTYLSHPGGSRILLKGQTDKDSTLNSTVPFINQLKHKPESIADILNGQSFVEMQGRVMLHPDMLYDANASKVHSKIYFSDERSVEKLLSRVKAAVKRILNPHHHLAASAQAYSTPPRSIQLYNLITGQVKDETDPRLQELLVLAEDGENTNDEIMRKLEDPAVAQLEKMDPLSLQMVRAIEQSPLLAPLTDRLLKLLPTLSKEGWIAHLAALKDKYARIMAFLKSEGLESDKQTIADLAHLLIVEPDDPEFKRLQHILHCPHTRQLLTHQEGQKEIIGETIERLHGWGKKRGRTLRLLEDAGLLTYKAKHTQFTGITSIDPKLDPDTLRDILKMLIDEDFPFQCSDIEGYSQSEFEILNEIAKQGIEVSRVALRQIVADLAINEPISFGTACELLDQKLKYGEKWPELAAGFVRILKPFTTEYVIDDSLGLLSSVDISKLERLVSFLKDKGFLKNTNKEKNVMESYAFLEFLETLCDHKDSTGMLSKFEAYSVSTKNFSWHTLNQLLDQNYFSTFARLHDLLLSKKGITEISEYPSTLTELLKMPLNLQENVLTLLADSAIEIADVKNRLYKILELINEHQHRWKDLEVLLTIEKYFDYSGDNSALKWALEQDPTHLEAVCILLRTGFKDKEDSNAKLPWILNNLDFVKSHEKLYKGFKNQTNGFLDTLASAQDEQAAQEVEKLLESLEAKKPEAYQHQSIVEQFSKIASSLSTEQIKELANLMTEIVKESNWEWHHQLHVLSSFSGIQKDHKGLDLKLVYESTKQLTTDVAWIGHREFSDLIEAFLKIPKDRLEAVATNFQTITKLPNFEHIKEKNWGGYHITLQYSQLLNELMQFPAEHVSLVAEAATLLSEKEQWSGYGFSIAIKYFQGIPINWLPIIVNMVNGFDLAVKGYTDKRNIVKEFANLPKSISQKELEEICEFICDISSGKDWDMFEEDIVIRCITKKYGTASLNCLKHIREACKIVDARTLLWGFAYKDLLKAMFKFSQNKSMDKIVTKTQRTISIFDFKSRMKSNSKENIPDWLPLWYKMKTETEKENRETRELVDAIIEELNRD